MERSVSQPDQQKHLGKKKEVDDKSQDGKLQAGQGSTDEGRFTLYCTVICTAVTGPACVLQRRQTDVHRSEFYC